MVKQGDIIKVSFNPQLGHEQAGYRPALIVSNDFFNAKAKLVLACPISNTQKPFPLHLPLPADLQTTGAVFCEHIKSLDLQAREFQVVETVNRKFLEKVLKVIRAEIEPLN